MRRYCALACLASSTLPDHYGFLRRYLTKEREKTAPFAHAFEIHANNLRLCIARQIIEIVAHIQHRGITKTDRFTDFYAVIRRGQTESDRVSPTLANKPDCARF